MSKNDRLAYTLVLSIIASPTLSSDVRHKATGLLRQLHTAYSSDKASRTTPTTSDPATSNAALTPLTESEAKELEQELEEGRLDDRVETTPVKTGEVLRVHGIYMKERREFDIRTGSDGKLELWDAKTGERW